ncbi:hypothetical protein GCM10009850_087620 [Nonomuraea monospora]|uniref:Uncharacterized protein n=1 Tax=Nonomuraea monospora TaxID=568818 RepID=A0ABP5PNL8_9ACTN
MPTTELPADTAPTGIAELIAAHLVIHPPAPAPDNADGADIPTHA